MWDKLMVFFSGLTGSLITSIAEKVTWRRVIVIAIFGSVLTLCGSLLWSVGSVLIDSLRSLSGASSDITGLADRSEIISDFLGFMPEWVRYFLYSLGADWLVFLGVSVANLYLFQICFRRLVKWGVSVVSAIYNTL